MLPESGEQATRPGRTPPAGFSFLAEACDNEQWLVSRRPLAGTIIHRGSAPAARVGQSEPGAPRLARQKPIHIAGSPELQQRLFSAAQITAVSPSRTISVSPAAADPVTPSQRHRTDARPGAETDHSRFHEEASILTPRRAKRLKNRLAKQGLDFLHFEQGDAQLVTIRAILTQRKTGFGRAFVYPRSFVKMSGPRVIADAILSDYVRGYGVSPRVA